MHRVIVTAGGSGIGRAISEAFLKRGDAVHVCDVAPEGLEELKRAWPDVGMTRADVANPAAVERLFGEAQEHLGGLDVLVNNAGIAGPTGSVEELTLADWTRTLEVNLTGAFLCLRRAVGQLRESLAASVVNIASTAGFMGYPMRTPYAAAKWAVVGLTKSAAMELGASGIRVNAVCPGAVEGARMTRVIDAEARALGETPERVRERYAETVSMRCFIRPEEIAAMVLFLCSPAGAKITGQAIAVDGHTETLRG